MCVHIQRRTYTPHVPLYTTSLYIDGCILCIFYYLTRMHSKYSPPYIRTSARTHMDIYTPCTCIHHTSFILMNVFSVFSTFLQLHIWVFPSINAHICVYTCGHIHRVYLYTLHQYTTSIYINGCILCIFYSLTITYSSIPLHIYAHLRVHICTFTPRVPFFIHHIDINWWIYSLYFLLSHSYTFKLPSTYAHICTNTYWHIHRVYLYTPHCYILMDVFSVFSTLLQLYMQILLSICTRNCAYTYKNGKCTPKCIYTPHLSILIDVFSFKLEYSPQYICTTARTHTKMDIHGVPIYTVSSYTHRYILLNLLDSSQWIRTTARTHTKMDIYTTCMHIYT